VKSRTTARFRRALEELPSPVRRSARRAYLAFQRDPNHPSLQLKKVHQTLPIFSARISLGYRAVGSLEGDCMVWFWIGTHARYDQLVTQMRRA
jgi:hypothetical protein